MLFARFSCPVIQRIHLVRRGQPVHVSNGVTQCDVLLLFAQLLQILLVQSEHVRFEFSGILGERAFFLDVAPNVVCKQLVCVRVQLMSELLKRRVVFGMQLQILFNLALVSQRQVLELQLGFAAGQVLNAFVIRVAKLEALASAALAAHQPREIVRRIQRGVHFTHFV